MQYLERIFKKHPLVFLAVTFVFAGFIASAFQEIGNAFTHIIVQIPIPIFNTWGGLILGWIITLSILFLVLYFIEKFLIHKWKKPKFLWAVVNDNYARVHIINDDKFSLDECKGELVRIYNNENNRPIDLKHKYFAWSNEASRGGSQQTTSIPVGHDSLLDIATKKKGKINFTFAYHPEEFSGKGSYTLTIKFSGEKNGFEFSKEKDFILEFDGVKLEIKPND